MGAISGIVGSRPVDRAVLERMSTAMRHRGADHDGIWIRGGVGFAHRGLKIEREAGGAQPLTTADGATVIAFSGHLFNRRELRRALDAMSVRLATGSDAEIVLRSYEAQGESCVERFDGQFAFAIWDARTHATVLARDAIGICPLHYAIIGDELRFSSEAKGILAHPEARTDGNEEAVGEALLCGALFAGNSMFSGVRSVEPGAIVTVRASGCRSRVYWSVPREEEAASGKTEAVYAAKLPAILDEAIRSRIDGATWGVLLSGGTDSSALTAFASRAAGGPVQTFSIDFPSRWRGGDVDEHYAALVAETLDTEHRSFTAEPAEYFAALETLAWFVERPYNKAAATMYLLTARLAPYAQYVMSGEGMDEMLAGYVGARGLGMEDAGGEISHFPWAPYVETVIGLLATDFRERIRARELFAARLRDALAQTAGADRLNQRLYLYTAHFLRELLALHEQGSLGAGVETRFPFLARRVVEFLTPLPSSLKFHDGQTKAIFRKVIRGLVPDEILDRRKTHLPMPRDPAAVKQQLEMARELVCSPSARTARYFDPARLKEFLEMRLAGADVLTVWQVSMNMITLELLYRQFGL